MSSETDRLTVTKVEGVSATVTMAEGGSSSGTMVGGVSSKTSSRLSPDSKKKH